METVSTRLARRFALLVPALLLAGAYVSEYGFGLFPCEMCWWQRYAHFAALGFAILALVLAPKRLWLWLAASGLALSGLIGGYHAGVEYGWWEGITECTAGFASPDTDPLEAILNAPLVRCDVAPWELAGVSLAGWNFLFSIAAALAIALLLTRERGTRT